MAEDVAKQIEALREEIRRHDFLYYVEARPEISDRAYDRLFEKLRGLEEAHPEWATPDSPTRRVGGAPIDGFKHVRHAAPMLSIDNTYNEGDLRDFDGRVSRGLEGASYTYLVDPKIDGVSASLRYEDGALVQAATRGDGRTGDVITENVKTIRCIPLRLRGEGWPGVLEVRGEVYWPRKAFDAFNAELEKKGSGTFKNPRNATAGTLKQLDSRAIAGRGLAFIAHGHGVIEGARFETSADLFAALKKWGIPVSPHRRMCKTIDEVIRFVQEWDKKRHDLEYETDGLVIKVDSLEQRDILGATSRYPRWCIAYKYAAQQAETELIGVDFQVGKLGTITPRARMNPVELSGTTVQYASLHNFDQVARLDVRVGDIVVVEKAGEIIPQVVRVAKQKKPRGPEIKPPQECPVCKGAVEKDEGGVYVRCINPSCDAQIKERLKYFAGRNQMDIEGLGEQLVEQLVDAGLVREYADLYSLSESQKQIADLVIEKALGEETIGKILSGIQQARRQPAAALLRAAAIPGVAVGEGQGAQLRDVSIGDVLAAPEARLAETRGLCPNTAHLLHDWLHGRHSEELVDILVRLKNRLEKLEESIKIKFLGPVRIRKLVEEGIVTSVEDFFNLDSKHSVLLELKFEERFGGTRTKKLIKGIRSSTKQPLSRILAALNIPLVGTSTAEIIAEHFGSIAAILDASDEELRETEGVGSEVAANIRLYLEKGGGARIIEHLRLAWSSPEFETEKPNFDMTQPQVVTNDDQPLSGKTIVVTGMLENFTRSEIEAIIKELGGKAASSVSRKTDYLVAGEKAGSKLGKAKSLDVPVLSEADFLGMVGWDRSRLIKTQPSEVGSMSGTGILGRSIAEVPIAILDFETTGLTPGIDRVVEASVVRIDPGGEPQLVFDTLINPNRRMSATDIHGITDEDVADAPIFEDIAAGFLDAVSGCVVAAYNVYFDIRFFSFEFGRLGLSTLPPHFCLMYLRPMLGMGGRCRLAEACMAHGLPYEDQHIAAADCEASALLMNVYLKIMRSKGVVTFADLAELRSYKFTQSFSNDTLGRFPWLGSCDPSKVKSRHGALVSKKTAAVTPKNLPMGKGKDAGLRAYWDTLCDAVSDLDLEEDELVALAARRSEFGLSDEQVRAVHTKVYMGVLAQYADDWIITAAEREALRRLHECLREAGWAPGD